MNEKNIAVKRNLPLAPHIYPINDLQGEGFLDLSQSHFTGNIPNDLQISY